MDANGQRGFQRIECKAIEGDIYQKTRDEGMRVSIGEGGVLWWVSDEPEGVRESALVEHQRKPRPPIVSGAQFLEGKKSRTISLWAFLRRRGRLSGSDRQASKQCR